MSEPRTRRKCWNANCVRPHHEAPTDHWVLAPWEAEAAASPGLRAAVLAEVRARVDAMPYWDVPTLLGTDTPRNLMHTILDNLARAALAATPERAHRHTPDDEYDSPDERCGECGAIYIRRHQHDATCTGTDCEPQP